MEHKRKSESNSNESNSNERARSPEKRLRVGTQSPTSGSGSSSEDELEAHIAVEDILGKIPKLVEQMEVELKSNVSPVTPLEKFLNMTEAFFNTTNANPAVPASTTAEEKQAKRFKVWNCVKTQLEERKLVDPLLALLEDNNYENVHKHVIYFLGITATSTLEADPAFFSKCFNKFTSLISSVPVMIWLQYTCSSEDHGIIAQKLAEKLKTCVKDDELESTLQVILYVVESSFQQFQGFVGLGGLFSVLKIAAGTTSTKIRTLALKVIHQFSHKDEICSLLTDTTRLRSFTTILSLRNEIRDNDALQSFLVTIIKRFVTYLLKFSCYTPLICSGLFTELLYDISSFKKQYNNQLSSLIQKIKAKADENVVAAHLYFDDNKSKYEAAILLVHLFFNGTSPTLMHKMKRAALIQEILDTLVPVVSDAQSSPLQIAHTMNALNMLRISKGSLVSELPTTPPILDQTFKDWVNNERFHDVIFNLEDEKQSRTVYAHKMILVTKSQYFAMMFNQQSGLKESQPGHHVITLHGTSYSTFIKLLQKLYSNVVVIDSISEALELLVTADKFLMEDLKEECYRYILSQISFDTFETVFKLEESHPVVINHKRLQLHCLDWLLQQNYYTNPTAATAFNKVAASIAQFPSKLLSAFVV